ncbi:MAG: alginate acetyltransferase [Proteobacteria bacterium]|nr:MAG: alginate acetyltransferase [Pseudomonadota bacterium]
MIFSSIDFLLFFIALIVALWLAPKRFHAWVLLLSSYAFYAVWDVRFLLLLFFVSWVGYACGLAIERQQQLSHQKKGQYLWLGIFSMLLVLGYFKYANFFIDNTAALLGMQSEHLNIILPVGLSFFTFQVISYLVDVWRGDIRACTSKKEFFLYVAFFPQLVAGPIVRAKDFLPQLQQHVGVNWDYIYLGAQIFALGFIQKVFIADRLAMFCDPVFALPALYDAATLWLALLAYAVQIFCDFSGYSHMAIGIALVLGFKLPENFRMPYLATSIADFWRRWHISLSSWLRDYLYIPLGGSRVAPAQIYVNLMITMLLGGLWHGASWNFVLWGAMHGLALCAHRIWKAMGGDMPALPAWALCLLFVLLTWVPFRCADFETSLLYFSGLLFGEGIRWMMPQVLGLLALVAAVHIVMAYKQQHIGAWYVLLPVSEKANILHIAAWFWLVMALLVWSPTHSAPFIYFQF